MDLPFLLRNGRLHDPIYERAMVNFIYSHIIDPRTAEYPSRAAHELLRGNAGHAGQGPLAGRRDPPRVHPGGEVVHKQPRSADLAAYHHQQRLPGLAPAVGARPQTPVRSQDRRDVGARNTSTRTRTRVPKKAAPASLDRRVMVDGMPALQQQRPRTSDSLKAASNAYNRGLLRPPIVVALAPMMASTVSVPPTALAAAASLSTLPSPLVMTFNASNSVESQLGEPPSSQQVCLSPMSPPSTPSPGDGGDGGDGSDGGEGGNTFSNYHRARMSTSRGKKVMTSAKLMAKQAMNVAVAAQAQTMTLTALTFTGTGGTGGGVRRRRPVTAGLQGRSRDASSRFRDEGRAKGRVRVRIRGTSQKAKKRERPRTAGPVLQVRCDDPLRRSRNFQDMMRNRGGGGGGGRRGGGGGGGGGGSDGEGGGGIRGGGGGLPPAYGGEVMAMSPIHLRDVNNEGSSAALSSWPPANQKRPMSSPGIRRRRRGDEADRNLLGAELFMHER